jgi:hypothetical protein
LRFYIIVAGLSNALDGSEKDKVSSKIRDKQQIVDVMMKEIKLAPTDPYAENTELRDKIKEHNESTFDVVHDDEDQSEERMTPIEEFEDSDSSSGFVSDSEFDPDEPPLERRQHNQNTSSGFRYYSLRA